MGAMSQIWKTLLLQRSVLWEQHSGKTQRCAHGITTTVTHTIETETFHQSWPLNVFMGCDPRQTGASEKNLLQTARTHTYTHTLSPVRVDKTLSLCGQRNHAQPRPICTNSLVMFAWIQQSIRMRKRDASNVNTRNDFSTRSETDPRI